MRKKSIFFSIYAKMTKKMHFFLNNEKNTNKSHIKLYIEFKFYIRFNDYFNVFSLF